MPIKFLLFDQFCNYQLSMLELDNIKAIKTQGGENYDGTLIFTFIFDNYFYLKHYNKNIKNNEVKKSLRLIAEQKKLAKEYGFEGFKSFKYIKN